jgi:hypothetical protein
MYYRKKLDYQEARVKELLKKAGLHASCMVPDIH